MKNRVLTEQELREEYHLVRASQSNPRSFRVLYERYFDRIFNYVFRRTGDELITDDITSQTFYKALKNIKSYRFKGVPFSAWLYRIASNEINRFYNRTKRKVTFSIEEKLFKEIIDETSGEEIHTAEIDHLITILEDLPTEMLIALELRYFEEKSFREISFILNITESGAKMRVYRAIEKLRSWMQEGGYDKT